MSKPPASTKLQVVARSPFRIYYEGEAQMVSSANKVGKFDVLPGHADFFSVMTPGDVTIETDSDTINFKITNGIITVYDNEAILFVNM
jgi:F0F1-type ATP synthase epsilon subunit